MFNQIGISEIAQEKHPNSTKLRKYRVFGKNFVVSDQNIRDTKGYIFAFSLGVLFLVMLKDSENARPIYFAIAWFLIVASPAYAIIHFFRLGIKDGKVEDGGASQQNKLNQGDKDE